MINISKMENTSVHEKKDLIRKMRQHGDVPSVCRELGYSTSIFWTAMGKTDELYTMAEMKVLLLMYQRMLERQELREKLGLSNHVNVKP